MLFFYTTSHNRDLYKVTIISEDLKDTDLFTFYKFFFHMAFSFFNNF